MQGPNANTISFKQAFLKNLLLSLQARTSTSESSFNATSPYERKVPIKSSANVAMAAARGAGARWPKAILASGESATPSSGAGKVRRCRRIVTRCRARKGSYEVRRNRTVALREVIPGGRDAAMDDEVSLLREAMDYVVHLRAQVDVLRLVSEASPKIQLQYFGKVAS